MNVPDAPTREHAEKLAREPERVLDAPDQAIVAETIGLMLRDDFEGRIGVYAGAVERTLHLASGAMTGGNTLK